nr:embryonic stem cell related protein [Homo sapiens]
MKGKTYKNKASEVGTTETARWEGLLGKTPTSLYTGRNVHWDGAIEVCVVCSGEEPGPSSSCEEPGIQSVRNFLKDPSILQ